MRLRLVGVLSLVGFFLLVPAPVLADHCGAGANVSPPSGPPGTTFVFSTNLGARSDLYLYRNGHLVATVVLDNDDFVSYRIKTGPGDAGEWRARAEVRGQTECAAEASFTVLSAPDTSTTPEPVTGLGGRLLVGIAASLAGLSLGLRRCTVPSR